MDWFKILWIKANNPPFHLKQISMNPLIGITMGDPAGVGPEILLKSASNPNFFRKARYLVFGNETYLHELQKYFLKRGKRFNVDWSNLPVANIEETHRPLKF